MSLAKKYNRRRPLTNYRRQPMWAQNTYSDEYHVGFHNEPHRFHNIDYDEQNFWPDYHEHEDMASNDDENFWEDEFMEDDGVNRFSRATPTRRRRLGENDMNSGYRRRMNNQPNPYYSDKYYYNQDENRDAYEYEDVSDRQYGYDYYESFPSYGQVSEEERRFRRSDNFPQSGFEKRERRQGLRRRGERPSIRDKRY